MKCILCCALYAFVSKLVLADILVLSFRCRLLGSTWALLEAFWSILGTSWVPRWPILAPKMALGEPFGASWGALGRLLERLGALLGRSFLEMKNRSFREAILAPKRVPKGRHLGSQNQPKIDPNTTQNRSRFSSAKKTLFKIVLGASSGHLESILGPVLGHAFEFGVTLFS